MEQNGTFIITRQRQENQELIVSAYYEDGKAVELSCFCPEETELLGSIYIGKVKNIVKNLSKLKVGSSVIIPLGNRKSLFTSRRKQGAGCPRETSFWCR